MDARLIAGELEMHFVARIAQDRHANAMSNVLISDRSLLQALLPTFPDLSLHDIHAGVQASAALEFASRPATPGSAPAQVTINLRRVPGVTLTANAASLQALAAAFHQSGRQALAEVTPRELHLQRAAGTLSVTNSGYGPDDRIEVTAVTPPDGLTVTVQGRAVRVMPTVKLPGMFRGELVLHTSAGDVSVPITWHGLPLKATLDDPVDPERLLPRHGALDREATLVHFEEQLLSQGYRRLPGGCYSRARHAPVSAPRPAPHEWLLSAEMLRHHRLPASGYPPQVRIYEPDGASSLRVHFDGTCLHGDGLEDLLTLWDAAAGQRLTLTPYRGDYRAAFHTPAHWLAEPARERWIVSSIADLNHTAAFWTHLDTWLQEGPVRLLLTEPIRGVLSDLQREHPERLTVRSTTEPAGPSRVTFLRGETGKPFTRSLPAGQELRGTTWPDPLWTPAPAVPAPRAAAPPQPRARPITQMADALPAWAVTAPTAAQAPADAPVLTPTQRAPASSSRPAHELDSYVPWAGQVAHPVTENQLSVVRTLVEIVGVEGPIVGHHLYSRYQHALDRHPVRAVMTRQQLKHALNRAVYEACRRNLLTSTDEFGTGGQIGLVYALPASPQPRPRTKGDRTLVHIPPSELRVIDALFTRPAPNPRERAVRILEALGFGRFLDDGEEIVLRALSTLP